MGIKRTFFKNAMLLVCVNFILRLVFIAFRVASANIVGAECMGLYQLTFSVYSLSVTFASSGIHLASVRLITAALSKNEGSLAMSIFKKCFAYALFFGISAGVAVFVLSEPIGISLLGDVRTVWPLRAFAVSLPFIAISSVMTGYLYSQRKVGTFLAARGVEQLAEIAFFMLAAGKTAEMSAENGCSILSLGGTVAEIVSTVFLAVCFIAGERERSAKTKKKGIWKSIFSLSLSSAAGAYLRSALQTAENVLVPRGFKKFGATSFDALSGYGVLCSMVMPVIFFPSFILSSFSPLLIPEFTSFQAKKQTSEIKKFSLLCIKITLIFSCFIAAIFAVFGETLGDALYKNKSAGPLIAAMSLLVPFMYTDAIADGMLKGLGEYLRVLLYSSIDSAVSIVLILLLVPKLGLKGYIAVIYISTALNSVLSVGRLLKVSKNKINFFSDIVVPFSCAILCAFSGRAAAGLINKTSTGYAIAGIVFSIALFGVFVLLSRGNMHKTVFEVVFTMSGKGKGSNFKQCGGINNTRRQFYKRSERRINADYRAANTKV